MKGCLIAGGVAGVLFVIGIITGGVMLYNSFSDFPEYAKEDVVYKRYDKMIKSIDKCVKESDSVLSLAAKLENLELPEELVYLALEKESKDGEFMDSDGQTVDVIKKYEDGGATNSFVLGRTGYGSRGGLDIVIINHPITGINGVKSCTIYLKHVEEKIAPKVEKGPTKKETVGKPEPMENQ